LIGERLPATIELAIASLLIAIIFGIPLVLVLRRFIRPAG